MKQFLIVFQFLTIFPVAKAEEVSPEDIKECVRFFPVVGIVQGALLWLASHIFCSLFPPMAAAGMTLLFWALMSGALHLDGLADTVDGLYGGRDREEILKIMKRGDIGAIGTVALIILLLLKFSAIYSLPPEIMFKALFLAPLIGKGSILFLNLHSVYARKEGGLGKAFVEGTTTREVTFTAISCLLLALLMVGINAVLFLIFLAFLVRVVRKYFVNKIGGVTGDIMGAVAETSEALFLLGVLL